MNIGKHALKVLSGGCRAIPKSKGEPSLKVHMIKNKKAIIKIVNEGGTTKQITDFLDVSGHTVRTYLKDILSDNQLMILSQNVSSARGRHRRREFRT